MIRYSLIDSNDNTYDIDNKSFKLLSDDFDIEVDIVERSYQAGADFPGIQRDASKELTFQYDINLPDDSSFRDEINLITQKFRSTVKIWDKKLNLTTDVLYASQSIQYDEGGFLRGAKINVTFTQLTPYWEDKDFNTEIQSGLTAGIITINNAGYIETPAIFTIVADGNITKFSLRITETGDGIVIKDLQFGTVGLDTYIIDNSEGTAELNQILRNNKIQQGTGFFNLAVGINTIEFIANGSAQIQAQWKRRYYI